MYRGKCSKLSYGQCINKILLKLYRQIVGIPKGIKGAYLVADLFMFCYERDFMLSLCDNTF